MKRGLKTNPFDVMRVNEEKDNLQEYPLYPDSEDIYNKSRKEENLDPEDISKVKKSVRDNKVVSDIDQEYNENESGSDLDIPGSELDDEQEMIGSEDEENNYYSLGGDDHNDLDEDKDEM
jgi:hypothetical protein